MDTINFTPSNDIKRRNIDMDTINFTPSNDINKWTEVTKNYLEKL